MKIHYKFPDGGELKFETDGIDWGYILLWIVLIGSTIGLFWLIYALR